MLDVSKLATLREVIARGSFSAAAHALALTQPAVSRQVSLLERQAGTQLVRRTQRGVQPTEAGRLLAEHATAVLGRLALAEEQLAELAGATRGLVRLGYFFTAFAQLSPEVVALVNTRHPGLDMEHELVDRRTALRRLAAGELDIAVVFDHAFAPDPAPDDVEIVPLFDDPVRVLVPAGDPLATRDVLSPHDLAGETWIRAHEGSAAHLVDLVLREVGSQPAILSAGRGDEPVESQVFVVAGRGVTAAYDLNVIVNREGIAIRPLTGSVPPRRVQAAIMRNQRAPAARAVLDALVELGREHSAAQPSKR
jgi:DNA-binding transcriptional LysR family regulator